MIRRALTYPMRRVARLFVEHTRRGQEVTEVVHELRAATHEAMAEPGHSIAVEVYDRTVCIELEVGESWRVEVEAPIDADLGTTNLIWGMAMVIIGRTIQRHQRVANVVPFRGRRKGA